jgi:hypothetical protein
MKNSISQIIIYIFLSSVMLVFYSCSANLVKENDISNLSPNYFICDSVSSTPVLLTLKWNPKENDSIYIEGNGGPCAEIDYKTGWTRDSVISIKMDSKKEPELYFLFLFGLSSEEEYEVHFSVSINSKLLLDEDCLIKKDPKEKITKQIIFTYLPLFNFHKFKIFGGLNKLSKDYPEADINFAPYCVDSLECERHYNVTDYFNIELAANSKVTLYNKYLNENVGTKVKARVNEFRKYKVKLLEPYNDSIDDTVTITFSKDDFTSKYRIVVTKRFERKNPINNIIVKFESNSVYPGDTLNVKLSYRNEQGKICSFPDSAKFEAGVRYGCSFANILTHDGKLKKFVGEIKQPIRVVIDNFIPEDESNVVLRVGHLPEGDAPYPGDSE